MGNFRKIVTSAAQPVAFVNTEPPAAFSADALFPPKGSGPIVPAGTGSGSGPGSGATIQYIMNLTDPTPEALPTNADPSSAGDRQKIARIKIRDARMSLAQKALTDVADYSTAAYPLGSWLADSMKTMGAPLPASAPGGLVSERQVLSALVDGRFGNPSWYANVAQESSSDLLREIAYEEAIEAKIDLLQYEAALSGLAIDASRYAISIK